MDFSKLLYVFITLRQTKPSWRLSKISKLVESSALFEQKLLNQSEYSIPWVRCAFGNFFNVRRTRCVFIKWNLDCFVVDVGKYGLACLPLVPWKAVVATTPSYTLPLPLSISSWHFLSYSPNQVAFQCKLEAYLNIWDSLNIRRELILIFSLRCLDQSTHLCDSSWPPCTQPITASRQSKTRMWRSEYFENCQSSSYE